MLHYALLMLTNNDIIIEARKWIGTPYIHQGRLINKGCDCVGLIIGIAKKLNISSFNYTAYDRQPDPDIMGKLLTENLIKSNRNKQNLLHADILWIKFGKHPQHLAIVTDLGIIHSYSVVGKVVEHRIDNKWQKRIVGIFRYPNIENI